MTGGMAHARNDTLYRRVTRKGLLPAHVAEVGVHQPESSNVYRFIQDGVRYRGDVSTTAGKDSLTLRAAVAQD